MKKKRGRQAFSLFAFQDIITSVTAIVLLFTLLLVLALVSRKSLQAAAATSASMGRLAQLAGEMAEPQVADFHGIADAEDREQVLAIAEALRAQLEQSIHAVEQELRDVRLEQEALTRKLKEQRGELRQEVERSDLVDAMRREIVASRKKVADLQTELSQLSQEIENAEKRSRLPQGPPVLQFREDVGRSRGSCLVVLGQGRIFAVKVADKEESSWTGRSSVANFRNWLQSQRAEIDHCVVLVRPSGLEWFDDIVETIQGSGIAIGKEVVGEGQKVEVLVNEGVAQ